MCQLASFYLTKDRIFWLPDSQSHSEIIQRYGLCVDGVDAPNVVRPPNGIAVEITPTDDVVDLNRLESWHFRADQDIVPEWYDAAECEARVRRVLGDALVNLTTLDATNSQIKDVSALVKRGCRIYR